MTGATFTKLIFIQLAVLFDQQLTEISPLQLSAVVVR